MLSSLTVGRFLTNCYVLVEGAESVVVDPGADVETILAAIAGTRLSSIVLTHGHADHHGALQELARACAAPVWAHPLDAGMLPIDSFLPLGHGQSLDAAGMHIAIMHLPGHTPGGVALNLGPLGLLVGDSLFPGGPGRTETPSALSLLIRSLHDCVFCLPDGTALLPGHGMPTTVGQERNAFERFLTRGWPAELCGDVRWTDVIGGSVQPAESRAGTPRSSMPAVGVTQRKP